MDKDVYELPAIPRYFGGIWPGAVYGLTAAALVLSVITTNWYAAALCVGLFCWQLVALELDKRLHTYSNILLAIQVAVELDKELAKREENGELSDDG